jgi:hypothetical protein
MDTLNIVFTVFSGIIIVVAFFGVVGFLLFNIGIINTTAKEYFYIERNSNKKRK